MTSSESTSSPSSQTARTNRSTRTDVLPVPAPAETNTSPRASTAASCSALSVMDGSHVTAIRQQISRAKRGDKTSPAQRAQHFARKSCPSDPAHAPQRAPARALAALRVVADVAGADSFRELPRLDLRALDLLPERVLAQVVGLDVTRQRVA